jgi:membrane-associated phospholipid phosphatase
MRDLGLTEALAPAVPEPVVPLLLLLTALGGPKLVAIGSTVGSIALAWTGRVERDRARRFLIAVALALSASIFFKRGLAMPRPPETLLAIPEDGYGFPSGHATAAAGLATALLGVSAKERWQYALAAGYVTLIGATRIFLGVHYLTDVLAGIALGVVVASIGLGADRRWPRRTLSATVGIAALALAVWALF